MRKLIYLVSGLSVFAWLAYLYMPLPSDSVLYDALLAETNKRPGVSLKLPVKELFPGRWVKVCAYGTYKGREEILRHSGIDIEHTRARVWAGGEHVSTFLFVYPDGSVAAQRIEGGLDFDFAFNPSCGNKNSAVLLRLTNQTGSAKYRFIFLSTKEQSNESIVN